MQPFAPSPGTGDLYENPQFVNAEGGNFALNQTSLLIGAGENGSDMGAIPYTPRPLYPTNLQIATQQYQSEVQLSWINPTHRSDGTPLTALDSVILLRNGTLVATLISQAPGANAQVQDVVPQGGKYRYQLIALSGNSGIAAFTNALWIGPPAYAEIPYDWVEISSLGQNAGITQDDENLGPFPIGFNFPWYDGNHYDALRICSNGFLSFSSDFANYLNSPIPNSEAPNDLIAPYWDDLTPGSSGVIYTYQDVANGRFIVEWKDFAHFGWSYSNFSFEAILYETGDVDFMYLSLDPGTGYEFPSATAGFEDAMGMTGLQLTYNGAGPWEPQQQHGVRVYSVGMSTGIKPPPAQQPQQFAFHPAFPNPFNPATVISYQLSAFSFVNLEVYDTAGRLVETLVHDWEGAGEQRVTFDGSRLPSGIYFVRLMLGETMLTQKLLLLK